MPEGFKAIWYNFPEEEALAIDKTAWDWTMPPWVVALYFHVKMLQVRDATPEYQRMVLMRMSQVVGPDAVVRLPDGQRVRQHGWGLMKSGWLLTLSMNSMAQWGQHSLTWQRMKRHDSEPLCWAMGDDMLLSWRAGQALVDKYVSVLATTGCIVKHAIRSREFAGFKFEEDRVEPLYIHKHRFALRYLEPKLERQTLLSYGLLYALSCRSEMVDYACELGYSRAALYSWATGLTRMRQDVAVQFTGDVE